MKTNFKELVDKKQEIVIRYGDKAEITSKGDYGIDKWIKKADEALKVVQTKYMTEFQTKRSDIEIDTALEIEITKDGKTVKQLVLNESKEYTYSKEGEKEKIKLLTALSKDINTRCDAEEIEYEPYLVDAETIGETDEEFIKENKNIFIR